MDIRNTFIKIENMCPETQADVQKALFSLGASWIASGQTVVDCCGAIIVVDEFLEMCMPIYTPCHLKEITLGELLPEETLSICTFESGHFDFSDSEVALSLEEVSEIVEFVRHLSEKNPCLAMDFHIQTHKTENIPLNNVVVKFRTGLS